MSKLLDKPVAVLGGGACGQAFAADFALTGCDVRLYELPEFVSQSLGQVIKTREIELGGKQANFKWYRNVGVAKIGVVTTDISNALKEAGLVIVAIPSKGQKAFFTKMIPYLENGQIINIFPDNFGSFVLRQMMRQSGCKVNVVIGGWSSMPYGVRMPEPGKLDCLLRAHRLMCDALPSKDGDKLLESMKNTTPFKGLSEIVKGDTMLAVGLSNPNPIVHVSGSILSVGPMEVSEMEPMTIGIPKGSFSMYKHAMSPSVARTQYAFYQEVHKIADVLGIEIAEYKEEQFFSKTNIVGYEYLAPFSDTILPPVVGPNSVEHRYFSEDIPVGCVVFHHLAKICGVDIPIIESLIHLGSVICRRDFLKEGRTLAEMGIENLTVKQLVKYAREGLISS